MRGPSTDWMSQLRWWPVVNGSGETIPAGAAMKVVGYDTGTGAINVAKPDADDIDPSMILINMPVEITAGATGQGTFDGVTPAATSGSIAVGDRLGTANGSWLLTGGKRGFRSWGLVATGVHIVVNRYRATYSVTCVLGGVQGVMPSAGGGNG